MMSNYKTLVIANPASGGGSLGREWGRVADAIHGAFGPFEHRFTESGDHAPRITRDALESGFEQVVALGGDGTISQVAAGFMDGDQPINPDAVLGVLPLGTGGDFRKTVKISKDLKKSAAALRGSASRPLDIGRIHYTAHNGEQASGYFINIASFGMAGLVDRYVNESSKSLGGTLSFLTSTVRAATTYRNQRVDVTLDDTDNYSMKIINLAVANGQFFGGGMRVAPYARPDDGYLDVVAIGDFSPLEMLRFGHRIYLGSHLAHPKVRPDRVRRLEARPSNPDELVLLDVDGETPGRLPATFSVLPGALNLKIID